MILPDGRVLVHNLTAMVAEALVELNPADESIQRRVLAKASGIQPPGPGRIQATDGAGC